MNKYEKLREGKSNWYGELKRTIGIENVKTLEELVERATPKKMKYVRVDSNNIDFRCECGLSTIIYDDINFCPNCGRALDLSDDDE